MTILNLYAGIGGNRRLWEGVKVTAVEYDPDIAAVYKRYFPDDEVIIGDAHEYLLENYSKYDFIWASPPCPTHSRIRYMGTRTKYGIKPVYPDMRLYQEIIFLKHYASCDWVVENVRPFYTPLIPPTFILDRHLFWSNRLIMETEFKKKYKIKYTTSSTKMPYYPDFNDIKIKNKKTIIRNTLDPEIGKYILEQIRRTHDNKKRNIGIF